MMNTAKTIGRRTVAVALLLLGVAAASPLRAQTNEPPQRHGRYLFIVETSEAMRKRMDNTLQTVRFLLTERLTNQLAEGDTVGLWTFDEKLHSGQYPMQVWSPGNLQIVPKSMADFLHRQPLVKEARMDEVMPALGRLMRSSERITVFILSSGTAPISGTPFDSTLNENYKLNEKDLRKKGLPFVTSLRAWHGRIIGGSIAWQPWPIDLPQFPPDPKRPKPAPVEAAPAPVRQSLIVIGEKPAPAAEPVSPIVPSAIPQPSPVAPETRAVESTPVPAPTAPTPRLQPQTNDIAAAVPPKGPGTPVTWMVLSVGSLLVGLTFVVLLIRRAKGGYRKSLITQSMERDEK